MENEKLRKRLASILALIKIRSEDFNYDPKRLKTLFLADTYSNDWLETNDFFEKLEQNLTVPLVDTDKDILREEYGDVVTNKISVKSFLLDIGMWSSEEIEKPPFSGHVKSSIDEFQLPSERYDSYRQDDLIPTRSSYDPQFFQDLDELKKKYSMLGVTDKDMNQPYDLGELSPSFRVPSRSSEPIVNNIPEAKNRSSQQDMDAYFLSTKNPTHFYSSFDNIHSVTSTENIKNDEFTQLLGKINVKLSASEHKLLQELDKLPNAQKVGKELISKVLRLSQRNHISVQQQQYYSRSVLDVGGALGEGFVSCSQLADIFVAVGLRLSSRDIEYLAAGFASDGEDGINASEFCQMLEELIYHQHKLKETRKIEKSKTKALALQGKLNMSDMENMTLKKELLQLCEIFTSFHQLRVYPSTSSVSYSNGDRAGMGMSVTSLAKSSPMKSTPTKGGTVSVSDRDRGDIISSSIKYAEKIISRPFTAFDDDQIGLLPVSKYVLIINELFPQVKRTIPSSLAEHYAVNAAAGGEAATESNGVGGGDTYNFNSSLNASTAFDFNSLINNMNRPATNTAIGARQQAKSLFVNYRKFLSDFIEVFSHYIQGNDGAIQNQKSKDKYLNVPNGWLLEDYDLFHNLLTQLECMPSRQRRKCLISLSHMLAMATSKETDGGHSIMFADEQSNNNSNNSMDGFKFLDMLQEVGFTLSKESRLQLLNLSERMGPSMDFKSLCQILLRCCKYDWIRDEKKLFTKIVKSMGTTIPMRKKWLMDLKRELTVAKQEKYNLNHDRQQNQRMRNPYGNDLADDISMSSSDEYVTPAVFLKCLRKTMHSHDSGQQLDVEEEALLLDCLDFETLTFNQQKKSSPRSQYDPSPSHNGYMSSQHTASRYKHNLPVPHINYHSFLLFCARQCGHWSDAHPQLVYLLKSKLLSFNTHNSNSNETANVLDELKSLFQSFDEDHNGTITERSFQVLIQRSSYFTKFKDQELRQLKDILISDGMGVIKYHSFIMFLKSLIHQSIEELEGWELVDNILVNIIDTQKTFLPFRKWFLTYFDQQMKNKISSSINMTTISRETLHNLLSDFEINTNDSQLSILIRLVKTVDTNVPSIRDPNSLNNTDRLMNQTQMSSSPYSYNMRTSTDLINIQSLFLLLMKRKNSKVDISWIQNNKLLIRKLKSFLLKTEQNNFGGSVSLSREYFSRSLGANLDPYERGHHLDKSIDLENKREGLAKLHQINSRLSLFAANVTTNTINNENQKLRRDLDHHQQHHYSSEAPSVPTVSPPIETHECYVAIDIFQKVCKASGLELEDDELQILADSTDPAPAATRISCNLFTEVLKATTSIHSVNYDFAGNGNQQDGGSPAAIRYVGELLVKEGRKQKRNDMEWTADLLAVLKGYDSDATGVMSVQELADCLSLVNVILPSKLLDDLCQLQGSNDVDHCSIVYEDLVRNALHGSTDHLGGSLHNPYDAKSSQKEGSGGRSSAGVYTSRLGRGNISANKNNTYNSTQYSTRSDGGGGESKPKSVVSLLRVVSRYVQNKKHSSSRVTDHGDDKTWSTLVNCFKRFDENNKNIVTAREFCLAVSILVDEDELVLTNDDWADIIDYYTADTGYKSNGSTVGIRRNRNDIVVDYMRFCHQVHDIIKSGETSEPITRPGSGSRKSTSAGTTRGGKSQIISSAIRGSTRASLSGNSGTRTISGKFPGDKSGTSKPLTVRGTSNTSSAGTLRRGTSSGLSESSSNDTKTGSLGQKIQTLLDSEEGQYRIDRNRGEKLGDMILSSFDDNELQALNTVRYEILACLTKKLKSSSSSRQMTMFQLIQSRLEDEDSNSNGSISRKQLLATLKGIGLRTEIHFKTASQKKFLDVLETANNSISNGFKGGATSSKEISIKDILCVIFDEILHTI